MALRLLINGVERELEGLSAGASLAAVVAALGLKQDRVAVERNHEIAPRSAWGELPVEPGDRLEVVHFVGGGAGDTSIEAHCT